MAFFNDPDPIEHQVSRDKLIARIQCFQDYMMAYRNEVSDRIEKESSAEDKEELERENGVIEWCLDVYEGLFEDICVCRNDGRV